jgi:glycosyltransferase involved in cell wall biosynthesis
MPDSGVSVVIPLYNKRATISRAIESVLGQEGTAFELIVVDDGSNDGSSDLARAYGNQLRYMHQTNAGPSAARNRGVRESRYQVVSFLDADDRFLPGCLHAHMHCRAQAESPAVTLAPFCVTYGDGTHSQELLWDRIPGSPERDGFRFVDSFSAELVINVHIGCMAVDKALFDSIGGFDEGLHAWEITEFLLRLMLSTRAVGVLDRTYLDVYQSSNSTFAVTRSDVKYLARFGLKLIELIDKIPHDQRQPFARQIKNISDALWANGGFDEFQEIRLKGARYVKAHGYSGKLDLVARLPRFMLPWLHGLKMLR